MRRGTELRILALPFLLILLLPGLNARADWDPDGSHKMHWPQLPDLSTNGMDITATKYEPWALYYILADDFKCTEDGPITNIHIWGSWYQDQIDTNAIFLLSIHRDIPPDVQHSMPSNPAIWEASFYPASYTWRVWSNDLREGWFEPPADYTSPTNEPPPDTICYQYNFPMPPYEPVMQESGKIYWLNVQVTSPEVHWFGWKTSTNHWNDDAVYDKSVPGPPPWPLWQELRYPAGHPWEGQSIDLAFVIDGGVPTEEETELCPKWLQPPDCEIGMDNESWTLHDDGDPIPESGPHWADDWECDGRPITALRWWGSYLHWEEHNPETNIAPPAGPSGFFLTWYTDIPVDPATNPFSRPGHVLAKQYYALASTLTNKPPAPGIVVQSPYCVSDLNFLDPPKYEHEYEFNVILPASNVWNEKDGRIYWLSIEAAYSPGPPATNAWGWKTTYPHWGWNDDAVRHAPGGATDWDEMVYPGPDWSHVTNHPYKGLSIDLAFELLSDICPRRCKKKEQPPNMVDGVNMISFMIETNPPGIIRADDFVSDGRLITDIHWWGSYIDWEFIYEGSETNPISPPTGIGSPLGFCLSWHEDGAACVPGPELQKVFVSISNCHETFYGTVAQKDWIPGVTNYEHEYQYYVDLLDPDLGLDPWAETNEVRYWLDIQAVFSTNYGNLQEKPHQGWGWKIAKDPPTDCPSVVDDGSGLGWSNEQIGVQWPMHSRKDDYFDLAFELTTTDIATNAPYGVKPAFTNQFNAYPSSHFMWTTGYCGCGKQILQESTNLLDSTWVDLYTNPVPRQQNLWRWGPLSTMRFYRVLNVP